MSRGNPILSVDIHAATAALLAGGKISTVAAEQGISAAWLCHHVAAAGLAHAWTTREERLLLADLRAGRALVVRADAAPAAARLAQRIDAALCEYRSPISARRQNLGTTPTNGAAASRKAAGECLRADTLSSHAHA